MTEASPRSIEVDRAIAAEPGVIFDMLRSPAGHVANGASGMLMSAEGDPAGAVGDRFVVHMDRDSLRDFDIGLYDWSNIHENYVAMADTVFPVISETNLRATLGILARTVAPGSSRPGS